MKAKLRLPLLVIIISMIAGCAEKDLFPEPESNPELKSSNAKLKIAIVSDIHYLDHSLLPSIPEENTEFQSLLFSSYNKMVEMSEPIFLQAVSEMKSVKPDVLLVPGDLAFNGELINHQIVKAKLQELADAGIRVLVVPGNNDINSPDAMSYAGTGSTPVPIITPDEFATLYGDFGYNDALYRDVNSLSYIFEIRKDLWVLGIDDCIYSPANKRNGAIKTETMTWIQEKMADANANGITVLAMMHHGISEHYTGQTQLLKSDVVNNFNWVSSSLMESGIKFVFTGHSHATDIVEVAGTDKSIFDVETGSLITPLSPYRVVTIDDNFLKIETKKITHIDATALPTEQSFITYSDSYLAEHLDMFYYYYFVDYLHLISPVVGTATLPYLRNAAMAQYAGDEKLLPYEARKINELEELYPDNPVSGLIDNFWTDLPPADDKLSVKLK